MYILLTIKKSEEVNRSLEKINAMCNLCAMRNLLVFAEFTETQYSASEEIFQLSRESGR